MKKRSEHAPNPYTDALRGMRKTIIIVGLVSAAINLLMLTGPIYMLQIYDRVLGSGSVATLQGLFIIVVVLYAFLGFYQFLRSRLLSRASYRLDKLVGDEAMGYWIRAGVEREDNPHHPVRDLAATRSFISGPAIVGLFDLPWIPIFLIIVFFIHPWLGYLTVAGASVVVIAAVLNQVTTRGDMSEAMARDSADRDFIEKTRRNAESVMTLGMLDAVVERWRGQHDAAMAKGQEAGDRTEVFASFSRSFRMLLQSALLTLGAFLALNQEITPGAIIAASIIAGRALAPVDQVIGQWRAIARGLDAHKRLKAAFDAMPAEKPRIALPPPKGEIKVKGLTKLMPDRMNGQGRVRILDQVTFALSPGDGLGVIGQSAAGKSSLGRCLVGVWQPDAGEVRMDGATLDQWVPRDLGRHIGYLPQTLEMLPGTIAENIARFDADATDAKVIEAAKIAGVHEMILSFPDGYATRIGDHKQPLSSGQIQQLGLARAIYGIPTLIVLDEPNSNLDANGDDALSEAIQTLRAMGSVVVVMAHRPSAIAAVNKIMVLHKGRVAQFGDKEKAFGNQPAPQVEPKSVATPFKTGRQI
ncbi:type I secretion system permease/ATPase [Maritimibacter sp. 55A14]|uniref:type I secretion system permease/ATPase n=1 Tax=Maritimibacter sp. 55A14 TaxID=2174844 RepID=UPI001304BB57|nr:type I secretion system permease/ATPase [Maritimibacter sp. 55A14]